MGDQNVEAIYRNRKNAYPYCGRLIVLDNSTGQLKDPFNIATQAFSIDFPAMPDQIELARSTSYRIAANMVMPDGIHQYMSTNPLEIPFNFKLHYGDTEYCREGSLTLLKLAARLHSLVAPLGDSTMSVQVTNDNALDEGGNSQPAAPKPNSDAVTNKKARQAPLTWQTRML